MLMRKAECEKVFSFFHVSSDRDAKVRASVVMRVFGDNSPTNKLICQEKEGVSCMSGQHGGEQALVKTHCPHVLFIHCYAHELNSVLARGTKTIQAAKLFSVHLDAFLNLFSPWFKKSALLCEVDQAVCVPGGSAVSWNFKSCVVHAIHQGRTSLCVAFDRRMAEPGWDKETITQSAALKQKLEDFDFTFLLRVFLSISVLLEPLFQLLQSKTVDIRKCQDHIKSTISALKATRTDETFTGF